MPMDTYLPIWHAKLTDRQTEPGELRHATVNRKQYYDLIACSVFLVALSENKTKPPQKRINTKNSIWHAKLDNLTPS